MRQILSTEDRSFAEFKCCRCSSLIPILQYHDDIFRPDTLFYLGVVHLKRIPKITQVPNAENLILKINDSFGIPSHIALWCFLLSSLRCFLEKPFRGGNRQRSSLSAIISKQFQDGVIAKKPKRDRKP